MSTIGQRLRSARKRAKLTQSELAEKIPVKSGAIISSWEQDAHMPNPVQIKRVCEVLGVGADYLLDYYGGDDIVVTAADRELIELVHKLDVMGRDLVMMVARHEAERCSQKPAPNIIHLPTRPIRYAQYPASAGTGIALDEEQFEAIDIPLTAESREADFVIRVSGDSMEPEYHEGDLLLIQQTDAVEPGELGIFAINGDGYFKRAGDGQLESLNPAYQPIRISDSDTVQTFGRVIGTTEQV